MRTVSLSPKSKRTMESAAWRRFSMYPPLLFTSSGNP
jgi:hypothetical protein